MLTVNLDSTRPHISGLLFSFTITAQISKAPHCECTEPLKRHGDGQNMRWERKFYFGVFAFFRGEKFCVHWQRTKSFARESKISHRNAINLWTQKYLVLFHQGVPSRALWRMFANISLCLWYVSFITFQQTLSNMSNFELDFLIDLLPKWTLFLCIWALVILIL